MNSFVCFPTPSPSSFQVRNGRHRKSYILHEIMKIVRNRVCKKETLKFHTPTLCMSSHRSFGWVNTWIASDRGLLQCCPQSQIPGLHGNRWSGLRSERGGRGAGRPGPLTCAQEFPECAGPSPRLSLGDSFLHSGPDHPDEGLRVRCCHISVAHPCWWRVSTLVSRSSGLTSRALAVGSGGWHSPVVRRTQLRALVLPQH